MSEIITLYGNISPQLQQQFAAIRLLILDVDGVLTDGQIIFGNQGEELKAFHALDGFGIKAIMRHGIQVAVITGRKSQIVANRMQQLGVTLVYQGIENKAECFNELCQQLDISSAECAYVGDDVVDLAVMLQLKLPIAVANAHPLVKQQAAYVTRLTGGYGAVREVCDLLLETRNALNDWQGTSG